MLSLGVPHQGKWVQLAIERAVFVDRAPRRDRIESRTEKPFAVWMWHHLYLTSIRMGKSAFIHSTGHSSRNFLRRKIGPQEAVALRKSAADLARDACLAGNDLRKGRQASHWFRHHPVEIHDRIIRWPRYSGKKLTIPAIRALPFRSTVSRPALPTIGNFLDHPKHH